MNKKQRIKWIDLSKAICIYCVVLGHALTYNEDNECIFRNFIYIFHMPVFFFISGYLFRIKENENSFISFSLSNIKSLVVPYIFLNILAIFLYSPIYLHQNIKQTLYYILIGHGHAPAGPAWFLLCLFWIKLQMFFVLKLSDRTQVLVALLYGILAYYFPWHLYWRFDVSFMAMPIFIIGTLVKKHLTSLPNKHYPLLLPSLVFIISFLATFGISLIQQKVAMYSRIFGTSGILFYIGAMIGILMIISLCELLNGFSNKVISVISSGSIIIMGLHGIFYQYTLYLLQRLSILPHYVLNIPTKIIICFIVIAEMYIPILLLQKYCSQFLGGRKY